MKKLSSAWPAWSLWALVIMIGVLGSYFDYRNDFVIPASIISILVGVTFATAGALIASRRASNPIGWLFLITTIFLAFGGDRNLADQYAYFTLVTRPGSLPGGLLIGWLEGVTRDLGFFTLITFPLLLFPTGHLLSKRWRLIAWIIGLSIALLTTIDALAPQPLKTPGVQIPNPLGILGAAGASHAQDLISILIAFELVLCIFSVFLRFNRAMGEERQQLKWFAFGAFFLFAMIIIPYGIVLIDPNVQSFLNNVNIYALSVTGLAIAVCLAILKYRLYEIDIILSRTLLYSVLTVTLALIYFGSVLVLQQVLRTSTGETSPITIVLSTLVIAALFTPLRRRLQNFIDRRFYRAKYDAARTLESFSAAARDEVEIGKLTDRLLSVAGETMQPLSISLWFKPKATGKQFKNADSREVE
jgi:hypothetical protein